LLGCSAYRQIAREFDVAPSTIAGQAARLGRHCLLFQEQHRPRGNPSEPLVIDGFESFEFSQYYPYHHNLAVGADSHFVYAHTEAELRRKGRMTKRQKRRRTELEELHGRPDPKAVENGVLELVRLAAPSAGPLLIRSDEHQAYPRAFRRLNGYEIVHEMTPSKRARTHQNPLFPVNLLDLLIRHCGANHKRETIAFSKRRASAALRLCVLVVWRNYIKRLWEKRPSPTPAQALGLMGKRLSVSAVLGERLFRSRTELAEALKRTYRAKTPTRQLPGNRMHRLRFAD